METQENTSQEGAHQAALNLAVQQCCGIWPLPESLLDAFAPAKHYLYEWEDHWLPMPGADCLRVGQTALKPTVGAWFNLRFENHIGLTSVQAFANGRPLATPTYLEVVSKKFPSPASHLAFYEELLSDLYTRAARLPFTVSSPTEANATETIRPPLPLFTLHFLCQYANTLLAAVQMIQAAPHRRLTDLQERVPLAEVTEAGPDVMTDILHHPGEWTESATQMGIAQALRGLVPLRVLQNRPNESFDTPENRFVRHFLRAVLAAADALPAQSWWSHVSDCRRASVLQCSAVLRKALQRPPLEDLGPMHLLPLRSQALLRREGYRDMLTLWQRFQQARRPLFSQLQHAIDVRDVAKLYEIWAYFALADDIAERIKTPVLSIGLTTMSGLAWNATADYGEGQELLYNHGFGQPHSYSIALRPDYAWMVGGRPDVVFDAKFASDRSDGDKTTAKQRDLHKMHTYRDALGVRAAVALYPGTETTFYDRSRAQASARALAEILLGNAQGIGALPYCPGKTRD